MRAYVCEGGRVGDEDRRWIQSEYEVWSEATAQQARVPDRAGNETSFLVSNRAGRRGLRVRGGSRASTRDKERRGRAAGGRQAQAVGGPGSGAGLYRGGGTAGGKAGGIDRSPRCLEKRTRSKEIKRRAGQAGMERAGEEAEGAAWEQKSCKVVAGQAGGARACATQRSVTDYGRLLLLGAAGVAGCCCWPLRSVVS